MATEGALTSIAIRGVACSAPDNIVETASFADRFSESLEPFVKMTGILRRHVALPGQTASDLSCESALRLLNLTKWDPQSVDALIFVSQGPDYILPATACVMHHRLGLGQSCLAFDLNLGCSGFVYGLFVAGSLCRKGQISRVLLCGGDTSTRRVSPRDKSTAMLFGDAGFAVALEFDEQAPDIHYLFKTDGSGFKDVIIPAGGCRHLNGVSEMREFGEGVWRNDQQLFMNGMNVFNFTITEVPAAIKRLMSQAGTTPEATDGLVLHQANLFILKNIAKITRFPMAKVPVSVDRYANTSVASIPLTLCDAYAGLPSPRQMNLILSGFGVGLSWGVLAVSLDPAVCLPVGLTANVYDDGELEC